MLPTLPMPEPDLKPVASPRKQGIFKLFLGYAPGVGKTYSMLAEAIRRHSRGEDVVIGVVESHGRKAVAELSTKLETIPRRQLTYKGRAYAEMDVEAILRAGRRSCWSMNWRTRIRRAASTTKDMKMPWSCWTRTSMYYRH